MIQITLPASCVTMLKEGIESKENGSEKKVKNDKTVTIAKILRFNSIKEEYFSTQKECEASLKKVAGI